MSEETRRVLDLLTQGKITVDEADRLLAAIGPRTAGSAAGGEAAAKGTATAEASPSPKYLRITITKARSWAENEEPARRTRMWGGDAGGRNREVSVRVPLTLVRNGMRLGAMMPGLAGRGLQARLRERGMEMDLSKIDAETIDQLVREFGEIHIDIESERGGKAQVRITAE